MLVVFKYANVPLTVKLPSISALPVRFKLLKVTSSVVCKPKSTLDPDTPLVTNTAWPWALEVSIELETILPPRL